MGNTDEIYIASLLDAITWQEIIDWAVNKYDPDVNSELNESYLELASLSKNNEEDRKEIGNILNRIIKKQHPDFETKKEFLAMKLLRNRCQDLVDGKIRPYDVCKLVSPIENTFDFPDWLGDLFGVCDYCEPETGPDSYFLAEVKERIKDIDTRSSSFL